jgi:hypothetical protein
MPAGMDSARLALDNKQGTTGNPVFCTLPYLPSLTILIAAIIRVGNCFYLFYAKVSQNTRAWLSTAVRLLNQIFGIYPDHISSLIPAHRLYYSFQSAPYFFFCNFHNIASRLKLYCMVA